ncbi:MAG: CDP-alcohol phosphatidyltransferase family protein [Burkholderiales bacterium]|nr:CDP-alcohol phosphatidyltransferase family protein [Burkholderiales bacterium]
MSIGQAMWVKSGTTARGALARRATAAVGAVLALTLLAAAAASAALGLSPAYVAKTGAAFLAAGTLVVANLDAHPFDRFGAANGVTLVRAALAALLAGLVGEGADPPLAAFAAAAGGIAVALDFVDGRLARASGLASAFGARFDMETDAALVLVLSILAWQTGRAGAWVLAAGALRYVFVAAGVLLPWMRRPLPPSARRQTAAATQMVALVAALAVDPPVSGALAAAALALLGASFAIDTAWLARRRGAPS